MDEVFYNKHYISVDEQNRIVNGFSDAFRQPSDTDICINEKGSYQFRMMYSIGFVCEDAEFPTMVTSEENPSLFDLDGMIPLYKWGDGVAIKRTEEEIEADRAAIPFPEPAPTTDERLASLEAENAILKAQINAQSEQMDFYEDCIAEMAMIVYA